MATWTVEISVANLDAKLVNITATRTGAETDVFALNNVSLDSHDNPLSQIRAEIGAALWQKHLDKASSDTKINALLSGYETALESDMNGMET